MDSIKKLRKTEYFNLKMHNDVILRKLNFTWRLQLST